MYAEYWTRTGVQATCDVTKHRRDSIPRKLFYQRISVLTGSGVCSGGQMSLNLRFCFNGSVSLFKCVSVDAHKPVCGVQVKAWPVCV